MIAPHLPPLPPWAPAALESSRLGVAMRSRNGREEQMQAFDWCSAVSGLLLAGLTRDQASMVCNNPEVLWILPKSRATYWKTIREEDASHWDGCEPSCIGLSFHKGLAVLVYDRKLTLELLQVAPIDSSIPVPESSWRIQAIQAFDVLVNTDLGDQTPFYI